MSEFTPGWYHFSDHSQSFIKHCDHELQYQMNSTAILDLPRGPYKTFSEARHAAIKFQQNLKSDAQMIIEELRTLKKEDCQNELENY